MTKKDVDIRLHSPTDFDAKELADCIKLARLFGGFRDLLPSDTQAPENLLLRLAALVGDISEIAELDLNPAKVMPKWEVY